MSSAPKMAVLGLLMIALFAALITAQENAIEMSISANNAASGDGLVQLHFNFNSSAAEQVKFRLNAEPCPLDDTGFIYPEDGYDRVGGYSCITKGGRTTGFSLDRSLGDCQLAFTFAHVDEHHDVTCWAQWSTPSKSQSPPTLSFELDTAYTKGPTLVLAEPLNLTAPTDWTQSSEDWRLGQLSIKYEKGKDLLWKHAPKEMTKDKLIIHFNDTKLEPYSQYVISKLNMNRNGTSVFNILGRFFDYNIVNAHVAKDVRVLHDGDLYVLTGATPATSFDIELLFSKFLAQRSARGSQQGLTIYDTITFSTEFSRVETDTNDKVTAQSEALGIYKARELRTGLTADPTISLTAQSADTVAFSSSYKFYAAGQNVTIDMATTGYAHGFKNSREFFDYYGNTTEVLYSCDEGDTWVDFDMSNDKIIAKCDFLNPEEAFVFTLRIVVPATKALKPFRIPLKVDGISTSMEWIPKLLTEPQQSLTKHTNKEIAFNTTSTYPKVVELSWAGDDFEVEIDTDVSFTTSLVYEWSITQWGAMLKDSLDCKAYNNNTALTVKAHGLVESEQLFKDKKVEVKAKAGDEIVMVCSTPINENPKKEPHTFHFNVYSLGNTQGVAFTRTSSTDPDEDWVLVDNTKTRLKETILGTFLFSPAPSTVDDAKKRIIKLLQTAKAIDEDNKEFLDLFKNNITTDHIFITGFDYTNHHITKISSYGAQNGLGKVVELNKKMPATWSFDGEDKRMSLRATINTTAFPDLYNALNDYQFTAANGEEAYSLNGRADVDVELEREVSYFSVSKLEQTDPSVGLGDGDQCFTTMQCRCVSGRCAAGGENPLVWILHDYSGAVSPFTDSSDLHDAIRGASADDRNAAFSATHSYSLIVIAIVAVVATLF